MKEHFVQRQLIDYLFAEHVLPIRINTGLIRIDKRVFRAHSLGPGCADILVPAEGSLWIEAKGAGKQTVAQLGFQRMVEGYGHRYVVAHSIDDLEHEWIKL